MEESPGPHENSFLALQGFSVRCLVPLELSLGTWQALLGAKWASKPAATAQDTVDTLFSGLIGDLFRAMRLLLLVPLAMAANVTQVSTSLEMQETTAQDAAALTGVTKNSPGDLRLGVEVDIS